MRLHANRNFWLSTVGWISRTCVSVAIITFLCLYEPTSQIFSFNGTHSLTFAAFCNVVIKDCTLGGTVINAWAVIVGCVVANFFSWALLVAIGDSFDVAYALIMLFLLCFAGQYIEFHPLGKKVGLSLFAINFVASLRNKPNPTDVWKYLADVLFATAVALLTNSLPWCRVARGEIEEIIQFHAVVS